MNRSLREQVASLFSMSDEQAMWRVQMHDDAHAFAQLLERWELPIQRLCARMLGDAHRGEDLAQETFARLFSKRKDYQPSGRFSTYLWRIALNLCYDELRRLKRRPETISDPQETVWNDLTENMSVLESPDALLSEREQAQTVRNAVMRLSESYRSVVILRHYENLKFREIAEVLGIPEGTVKSRMAEALTQLHQTLSKTLEERRTPLCKTQMKRLEDRLVL